MADFSFGFTESLLLLNDQKHFRSGAENLMGNKQQRTNYILLYIIYYSFEIQADIFMSLESI